MRDYIETVFLVRLPRLTVVELRHAFQHAHRVKASNPDANRKLTAAAYLVSRFRKVV